MSKIIRFVGSQSEQPTTLNSSSGKPVAKKKPNSEVRSREHLYQDEVDSLILTIKRQGGKHAFRDAALVLVMFRHGLRVGEAIGLTWDQVSFSKGTLHVTRLKNGSPATHFLSGRVCQFVER